MTSFEAWTLPPGFVPRPDEEASSERPPLLPLRHLVLSPARVGELAALLRMARDAVVVNLPVERVVAAVDGVARRLLDPGDPLRTEAVDGMGACAGYSVPMARAVLDGMARDWTRERLVGLLEAEFPDYRVLDGFRPGPAGRLQRALGCPLTFHLGAGSVPGVVTTSLIRALLVKSAALVKPGQGDAVLPVVFARGLAEEAPELGRAVAVVYWPGEALPCTEAALSSADLVVVYGGDETVRWVRGRLPPAVSLQAYRHRLGVALVGRDALGAKAGEVAAQAARAVALFDQRGCVSPHLILVEEGGPLTPQEWGGLLARSLDQLEEELPSGVLDAAGAMEMQQVRGRGEMEEALGEGTRIYHGGAAAPWTVLVEPGKRLSPSCLGRTVRVLPVRDLSEVPSLLEGWRWHLQTVGVVGLGGREEELRESLARMGVSRVAPLSAAPWPPPWWHHDGSGPLRVLVRWTDREGAGEEER